MAGNFIISRYRDVRKHNQTHQFKGCYRVLAYANPGAVFSYGAIVTISSNRTPGRERIKPLRVTHAGHRYAVVVYPKKPMEMSEHD